jgi:hypothetical protein
MIDSASETLLSLADAAQSLPRRRRGRKTHVSCMYRWTKIGCRGVVLESIQVGGTRCTSKEALTRFFERLSGSGPTGTVGTHSGPTPARRTAAQRQRASAEAGRELAKQGA